MQTGIMIFGDFFKRYNKDKSKTHYTTPSLFAASFGSPIKMDWFDYCFVTLSFTESVNKTKCQRQHN